MSIVIDGKEFRWPSDVLNVNDGRLVEAHFNGVKVYPDVGRYVVRTSVTYTTEDSPTRATMSYERSTGLSLSSALTAHYAGRRTFKPFDADVIREGSQCRASVKVDVTVSADEPWRSWTRGITDSGRTAKNLAVASCIRFEADAASLMMAAYRHADQSEMTENEVDALVVQIGEYQPSALAGGDIDALFSSKPAYKYTHIGGGATDVDMDSLANAARAGTSYVGIEDPFNASTVSSDIRVGWYRAFVNMGAGIVGTGTYYFIRPWWVRESDRQVKVENLFAKRTVMRYTNLRGTRINEKPPSWACDPRIPMPSDWKG